MAHFPRHCCHDFRNNIVSKCFNPPFSIDFAAPGMAAVRCGDLPLDENDAIVTRMKSLGCTWFNRCKNVIQLVLGALSLQRPDSVSFQTTFCVEDAFKTIRTRQQIEVFGRNVHVFHQFVESLCAALI